MNNDKESKNLSKRIRKRARLPPWLQDAHEVAAAELANDGARGPLAGVPHDQPLEVAQQLVDLRAKDGFDANRALQPERVARNRLGGSQSRITPFFFCRKQEKRPHPVAMGTIEVDLRRA